METGMFEIVPMKSTKGRGQVMEATDDYANDIPQSPAGAYNWLSQTPERRFAQTRADYAQTLREDLQRFESEAARGKTVHMVPSEFERYRANLRKRYIAAISSDSRCASSFITGPANFPVARMQKRNDIAARRWSELIEWRKRAVAAIVRTLRPDLAPVMSSDDDALARLRHKLQKAEEDQVRMKAVNAAHKRFLKGSGHARQ